MRLGIISACICKKTCRIEVMLAMQVEVDASQLVRVVHIGISGLASHFIAGRFYYIDALD